MSTPDAGSKFPARTGTQTIPPGSRRGSHAYRPNRKFFRRLSVIPIVEILARGRRVERAIPLLAHEDLVETDMTFLECHRRAREVEAPDAIDALTHKGACLVGPRLEPLHPLAAGPCVVEPQPLDIHDLPARPLLLGHGLGEPRQLAVGEDVLVEKVRLGGGLPVKLVGDAVIEVVATVVEHRSHATEEGRIVADAHVLDDADGGDL